MKKWIVKTDRPPLVQPNADIYEFLFENIQSVDGCKNIWGQKAGQVYPWDWKEDKINITAPLPLAETYEQLIRASLVS